jgi:hypothetical protein
MIKIALVFLLVVSVSTSAFGETKPNNASPSNPSVRFRTKIEITMDGPNEVVFKQCIFREMRKIPEVIVVEDDTAYNDYEVHIVVIEDKTRAGYDLGYSSSIEFLSPLNLATYQSFWKDSDYADMANKLLSGAVFPAGQFVMTDYSLDGICKRIVAEFDTQSVELMRQIYQNMPKPK